MIDSTNSFLTFRDFPYIAVFGIDLSRMSSYIDWFKDNNNFFDIDDHSQAVKVCLERIASKQSLIITKPTSQRKYPPNLKRITLILKREILTI